WPAAIGRALRRVLARALAEDRAARGPALDALGRALVVRPRGGGAVPVAASALGAAALLGRAWTDDDRCRDAAGPELALWDPARQQAIAAAFEASAMPFAAPALATTSAAIDAAVQRGVDAARSACAAAGLRDDPSFAPASEACRQVVRDEITTLLDELTAPSTGALAAAPLRATGLPDASACSDPRRAKLVGNLDADTWRALAPARAALARARQAHAELVFGGGADFATRLDAALADARDAAEQAEASAALVTAAIARTLEARLLARRGDTTAAEIAAAHAVEHAGAIDDPMLRTIAMLQRVYAIGAAGSRIAEARALAEQANASVVAAGDPPLLRGQLENNLGLVVARDGEADKDEAIGHHRRAIELFAAALGDAHPDTMAARVNLGGALARLDRTDDALAALDPIVAPALAVWGEDHPSTARLFGVIGNAWLRKGELARAETWLRRALASAQRFAPGDAEVANAQYNLATALRRRMDDEAEGGSPAAVAAAAEAVTLLRAAIAIREGLEAPAPVNLIAYRVALGEAELGAGDSIAAEAELRLALSTCERTGAAVLDFARVRLALGRAVIDREPAEARVLVRAAREAFAAEGRTASVQACDRVLARLPAP
ncbi:MAG: tetratricopeptide repeat protein, partial [Myxococcales bacterium]|nr:tetratricopeptide repeat protein [Myxococcales bacterium]